MTASSARPLVVDEATSRRFSGFPQRDTKPEMLVRRAVHAEGLRYRTRNRDLPGSPDLANRGRRWAVFVHGCYWHHHEGCPRATIPRRNQSFWVAKFAANRERDARAASALRRMGFHVVELWECDVERPLALASAVRTLKRHIERRARLANSR